MIASLLSLAAGFSLTVLVLWFTTSDKDLKSFWIGRLITALTIGIAMWKLTPLWTRWETVFDNPMLLLSMNGGLAALLGGVFAFLAVLSLGYWQVGKERPGIGRWPLVVSSALGLLLVGAWTLVEPLVVPRAGSQPGSALQALVPDFGGKKHALADWKGRVVIVNFWATWCPPCLAELPELKTFTQKRSDKVILLGVNLTATEKDGEAAVLRFTAQRKLNWTQLSDPQGELQKAFEVTTIPTTVVLDPEGRVVDRREGAVDLFWLQGLEGRFAPR